MAKISINPFVTLVGTKAVESYEAEVRRDAEQRREAERERAEAIARQRYIEEREATKYWHREI